MRELFRGVTNIPLRPLQLAPFFAGQVEGNYSSLIHRTTYHPLPRSEAALITLI